MSENTADYQSHFAQEAITHARRELNRERLWARVRFLRPFTLAGLRVLVVGAGRGRDCSYFVEYGAREVHGLDVADHLGADFQHRRVRYHNCSAERMDLATGSFDLVYSVATMEHIPNIDRAFSEMVRVTRPGGLIYCFAAPLWNAREGHHMFGMFPNAPWIHLRMSRDEMLAYCRREGTAARGDHDVSADVDFIFSAYFNRVPAARYVEVCRSLPASKLIHNDLWIEPADTLPDDVWRELRGRYTREELLAGSHLFVAVK